MTIKRTVDETANVTLLYTDASNTLTTTTSNAAVGFMPVIARKGEPNKLHKLNADNWEQAHGKPFHSREGVHAESLRHLADAVQGGTVYTIRVMPSDAKMPVLRIGAKDGSSNKPATTTISYGNEPVLQDSDVMAIYMIDGDNELERKVKIEAVDQDEYGKGFYAITLTETNEDSEVTVLERIIVSLNPNAKGVDNKPAFIEDKLIQVSKRLRAVVNMAKLSEFTALDETKFDGGTSGTYSGIGPAEYEKAIKLFKSQKARIDVVMAGGCYIDASLKSMKELADSFNVDFIYDVEPNLSFDDAAKRNVSLAMNSEYASAYHFPFKANDPFYGGHAVWGLSGFVFAALAKGVSLKAPTGGWHYTPAGEERATINRSGVVMLENAGELDEQAFVKARLNKLGVNTAGQWMIDDALTTRIKQDDLRFKNIATVSHKIGRDFVDIANKLKHSPDEETKTGLSRLLKRMFDGFVSSGCLVGDTPYSFSFKQIEKDLWQVEWEINVSGSMRRTVGKPALMATA